MNKTANESNEDNGAWPEITDEDRDYFLSEDGIVEVMRALSDGYGNWRGCPVKRCRRARRCQGPDMVCQLKEPSRTAPRDLLDDVNARMRRIVEQRLDRFGIYPW